MKYAKGKWESVIRLNKERGVRNEGGFICFLPKPTHYTGQDKRYKQEWEENKANAKLIAAAPLMYQEHYVNRSHCAFVIDKIKKGDYQIAINLLLIMKQNSEAAIKKAIS